MSARRLFRVFPSFLLPLGIFASGLAWAAGVEYPDNGTMAMGRAGAHAANPEDGFAFQYNPAGLAQPAQRGWRLDFDARLANQNVKFASATRNAAPVENSSPPFFAPGGAVSYGFGEVGPLSDLTVAIGATGPSAIGRSRYPYDGAQRYALDNTDYFIAYYSAAIAAGWKKGDFSARLGFTGQFVQGTARFQQAVWSGVGQYDEAKKDPAETKFDTLATFSGSSALIPTFVAGLSISPIRDLDIGVSYRPRIDFNAPGTLDLTLPASAQGVVVPQGNSASLQLNLAATLRLGVAYRPTSRVRLEVDGVWEQWSSFKEIRIATHDVMLHNNANNKDFPLPDVVFPHNMNDTWSVRLGADVTVVEDRFTVRAGYGFETSAIPAAYVSLDFPNWQRHIAAIGASVKVWRFWVDLAYAHQFVETQQVTNSQVMTQVSPDVGLYKSTPSVIGNGTYNSGLDVFSIALRAPFVDLFTTSAQPPAPAREPKDEQRDPNL